MVYRGKPSAGCEQCRKAKKRCDLGQPACSRCAKLKKQCTGYRDVSELQIQDESESTKLKANRQKARNLAPPTTTNNGIPTPATNAPTPNSDSSSSSDDIIDLPPHETYLMFGFAEAPVDEDVQNFESLYGLEQVGVPSTLRPNVDELATTYFFNQFTSQNGHWTWLRDQARLSNMDPVLELAIRACGIASFDNVQHIIQGREYSRKLYGEALGLLNSALRDPKRSKTDDSLVAVAMLGYYENLTCDSRDSILSWKAHIKGSTQLLKLRGKNQFKTQTGRMLFRETRSQILINCIWEDESPPDFLYEWEQELEELSPNRQQVAPLDKLTIICWDFSALRSKVRYNKTSDAHALDEAAQIEMRMIEWSIETMAKPAWQYHDLEVEESPHVWNGVVHSYTVHPAAGTWNTYRSMRIMLTRTQEYLYRRIHPSPENDSGQFKYFRSIRRQMADEICLAIPTQLGHASPAYNSPCILITAYMSIWPLFFAGTCALERIGTNAWKEAMSGDLLPTTSAAASQASWVIGRMQYISQHVGIHWADGVAATLRGEFVNAEEMGQPDYLDDMNLKTYWRDRLAHAGPKTPAWLKKIEASGRGPRILNERENALSDATHQPRSEFGPIWIGGSRNGELYL
ncbi:hypothetical protein M409DRAFT_64939 [Zasmidium cellare ATCC 36951]|uniref:Zn(2)-C6 fungal-type domain-containing protein n=1 Tax=Zasmidium cellare ATCC 36951 TaxID=1080233 RepID=A0A6A6CQ41_ZASCE|nr:uncharacterized protein M409DRAFT_64939 [Zasmidium cellare ATCC 36951]KAF2169191.1 hypothetical protein M409DRAFT_64939 [Zasmidium cellare ATCC 36951]